MRLSVAGSTISLEEQALREAKFLFAVKRKGRDLVGKCAERWWILFGSEIAKCFV